MNFYKFTYFFSFNRNCLVFFLSHARVLDPDPVFKFPFKSDPDLVRNGWDPSPCFISMDSLRHRRKVSKFRKSLFNNVFYSPHFWGAFIFCLAGHATIVQPRDNAIT